MGTAGRRSSAWRLLAGATTAGLLLSGCGADAVEPQAAGLPAASPSAEGQAQTDLPVEIVGAVEPEAFTVGEAQSAPEPGGGLYPVSDVWPVVRKGRGGSPALVRMALDNAVPKGTPVVVVRRSAPDRPWTYLAGDLDPGRRHVEFIVSEGGSFGVLAMDRPSVLAAVREDLGAVEAPPAPTAPGASCIGEKAAREDGYSARSWRRTTLAWCFGVPGEGRSLRLTNTRAVPVRVTVPGAGSPEVTGSATEGVPWDAWTAAVATSGTDEAPTTWLAPGRTASYAVDLEPGATLLATAQDDPRGRSVQVLRSLAATLATRLDAFGVVGAPTPRKLFADLLGERSCTRALDGDARALLDGCAREALETLVPGSGVLLAPVRRSGVLRRALGAELDRLAQEADQVEQRILVSREEPSFEGLVGSYAGPRRSLVVSEEGEVTERLGSPKGPVIELTYQLADADARGAVRRATATLLAVEVTDRTMIGGTVPQVGTAGTFSLERGVVTPPFLGTTYCTIEAAERCAG